MWTNVLRSEVGKFVCVTPSVELANIHAARGGLVESCVSIEKLHCTQCHCEVAYSGKDGTPPTCCDCGQPHFYN